MTDHFTNSQRGDNAKIIPAAVDARLFLHSSHATSMPRFAIVALITFLSSSFSEVSRRACVDASRNHWLHSSDLLPPAPPAEKTTACQY
jgi:hypothetical protein